MDRLFAFSGAILAAIAVSLGAFGAHTLKARLNPADLATFEIGARYQMYHALALFIVAWAVTRWPSNLLNASGWLFILGTTIFSGSLYLLAISGQRWLGAVTPLGGLSLIIGWAMLAYGILRA